MKKFFEKLFQKQAQVSTKKLDMKKLLASDDINSSIIKLDNYICELCARGNEMNKLTEPQKIFYLNQNLEREVNNGGFSQYFLIHLEITQLKQ